MSIVNNIVQSLKTSLLNIKKENGYLTNVLEVNDRLQKITEVSQYITLNILPSNDKLQVELEQNEYRECDIIILAHCNQEDGDKIIDDISKHLYLDKSIVPIYHSQLSTVSNILTGVITFKNSNYILSGNKKTLAIAYNVKYYAEVENISGGTTIVIPNILAGYSITSHTHNYATTANLLGYSLTSHTHTLINNALNINGKLTVSGSINAGWTSSATGSYCVAFGNGTQANGGQSLACGGGNKANGYYSFAAGGENKAIGNISSVFGFNNITNGDMSTAFGQYNITNGVGQAVFGQYNLANTTDLFQIGNGSGSGFSPRNNIFTVGQTHTGIYGTTVDIAPTSALTISSPTTYIVGDNTVIYNGISFDDDGFRKIYYDGDLNIQSVDGAGIVIDSGSDTTINSTGNLNINSTIHFDGDGFKSINPNYSGILEITSKESDSDRIKLTSGNVRISNIDGSKTMDVMPNATAGDSCIYFGTTFRIYFDSDYETLWTEYWDNSTSTWVQQTQLGWAI